MMRFVDKYLPNSIGMLLRGIFYRMRLLTYYYSDYRRFVRYSFGFYKNKSFGNLRAKLTLHYHSIEKGLSYTNIRLGFGKTALEKLLYTIKQYEIKSYPIDDDRYQNALNSIQKYIKYHRDNGYDVSSLETRIKDSLLNLNLSQFTENKARLLTKSELTRLYNVSFSELAAQRVSYRDYTSEVVDRNEIIEAIRVSINTPSVCNRQPWKAHIVETKEKIHQILQIQKGLNILQLNKVNTLLIITSNLDYFSGDKERNEAFIDGGMFSMSLLYALSEKGIGACALNANLGVKKINAIKKISNIDNSEEIIMFISVGYYEDLVQVPLSRRDKIDNFYEVH